MGSASALRGMKRASTYSAAHAANLALQPEQAVGWLEPLSRSRPRDPSVWDLLSEAALQRKDAVGVLRARAESRFLNGSGLGAVWRGGVGIGGGHGRILGGRPRAIAPSYLARRPDVGLMRTLVTRRYGFHAAAVVCIALCPV